MPWRHEPVRQVQRGLEGAGEQRRAIWPLICPPWFKSLSLTVGLAPTGHFGSGHHAWHPERVVQLCPCLTIRACTCLNKPSPSRLIGTSSAKLTEPVILDFPHGIDVIRLAVRFGGDAPNSGNDRPPLSVLGRWGRLTKWNHPRPPPRSRLPRDFLRAHPFFVPARFFPLLLASSREKLKKNDDVGE